MNLCVKTSSLSAKEVFLSKNSTDPLKNKNKPLSSNIPEKNKKKSQN